MAFLVIAIFQQGEIERGASSSRCFRTVPTNVRTPHTLHIAKKNQRRAVPPKPRARPVNISNGFWLILLLLLLLGCCYFARAGTPQRKKNIFANEDTVHKRYPSPHAIHLSPHHIHMKIPMFCRCGGPFFFSQLYSIASHSQFAIWVNCRRVFSCSRKCANIENVMFVVCERGFFFIFL